MSEPISDEERAAWGRLAEALEAIERRIDGFFLDDDFEPYEVLRAIALDAKTTRTALPRLLAENAELWAAHAAAEKTRDINREIIMEEREATAKEETRLLDELDAVKAALAGAEAKLAQVEVARDAIWRHGLDVEVKLEAAERALAALRDQVLELRYDIGQAGPDIATYARLKIIADKAGRALAAAPAAPVAYTITAEPDGDVVINGVVYTPKVGPAAPEERHE